MGRWSVQRGDQNIVLQGSGLAGDYSKAVYMSSESQQTHNFAYELIHFHKSKFFVCAIWRLRVL